MTVPLVNDDGILSSLINLWMQYVHFFERHMLTNDKIFIRILGEVSTFRPFQRFFFNSPHPQSSKNGSPWLIKIYTGDDFYKIKKFFTYKLIIYLH